jgi:amino acid adenylation domain-containing protein
MTRDFMGVLVPSSHQPAERNVTTDDDASRTSECAGPFVIPRDLRRALRALAEDAAADDFLVLVTCVAVLAERVSRRNASWRVRVIQGVRETVTPWAVQRPALTASFRTILRQAARSRFAAVPGEGGSGSVDVTLLFSEDGERVYAEGMTNSADAPAAHSWARSFVCLLTYLTTRPDAPVGAHALTTEADRNRILHDLNPHRPAEVSYRTVTGPFEERVAVAPDTVALLDESGAYVTYQELNDRANRLAHALQEAGAGPGTRVAVCLDRGISQVIAIYGAVKTGAAYVPLDAELPDSRISYMLADAMPLHVLTHTACRDRIPDGPWSVRDVEAGPVSLQAYPVSNPAVSGGPGKLLNILYTSGSTGRPKGVAYPVDGALAHLAWMQARYPFQPGDSALFKTSPGFDVSIWEIFWPLQHGARLLVCRPGGHRDPRHLAGLVAEHGISTIFLPPTVMTPFLEKVPAEWVGTLRWALCGGEPVTRRIRDTFYGTLPMARLVNCYGPTEAGTVTDMILKPEPYGGTVPLGRPASHFRLTVLDENLELQPTGMPGEAYISGDPGLAQAYWHAPGRTAERFVADPFGPPGSRMYRTGDLCRYRDDGVLEHLGRIDRQIKIHGLRVEPGEIESVLAAHPAVADCAVIAHGDPVRLLAFVVPASRVPATDLDARAILEHAAAILPAHMRPEQIVPLLRIPATVNGKIDTEALLSIRQTLADGRSDVVLPADELEAGLVDIYCRVLGTETVSVLDNFTQLGGHSLLAFQLLDECMATLHAKPDVAELLAGTVRDVALSMRAVLAGTDPAGHEP